MTQEEGTKLKQVVQDFLNDDMGNKLTKWNSNAFAQTIAHEIDMIVEVHKSKKEEKSDKPD
jgi:hypothetical protein